VADPLDGGAPYHEQRRATLYSTRGELYTVSKHGTDQATLAIWTDSRWLFSTETIATFFFQLCSELDRFF
jgi:hypothetical protein